MLTKDDFKKFENLLDRKLDQKLQPIKDDIVQIRKDQKLIVRFFDREYLDLRRRVEKIESLLKIPEVN